MVAFGVICKTAIGFADGAEAMRQIKLGNEWLLNLGDDHLKRIAKRIRSMCVIVVEGFYSGASSGKNDLTRTGRGGWSGPTGNEIQNHPICTGELR